MYPANVRAIPNDDSIAQTVENCYSGTLLLHYRRSSLCALVYCVLGCLHLIIPDLHPPAYTPQVAFIAFWFGLWRDSFVRDRDYGLRDKFTEAQCL
jgi:hypothetical protein